MANPFVYIAVIASMGKAYATYQSGMAQKAYYDGKADISKLQYKEKQIDYFIKGKKKYVYYWRFF